MEENKGAMPLQHRPLARSQPEQDEAAGILAQTTHRPTALPRRPWTMQQRWHHLLFAHWPVPASAVEQTLPKGLTADTFDGWAWLGVVPFGMDRIRFHGMPMVPGTRAFAELNLRTYVRERDTNRTGVYFYSLDASNPLAVAIARSAFHLPYYWARMGMQAVADPGRTPVTRYWSQRLFSARSAEFRARYRGTGAPAQGPLEQFLTARYALYTTDRRGALLRGDIHHLPWPLEHAEAEFERNDLPAAHGFTLPDREPVLHYARELMVYVWSIEPAARGHLLWHDAQPATAGSPVASVPRP